MTDIVTALADHAFEHLFIECLGWDRVRVEDVTISHGSTQFLFKAVAQKRGFLVFVSPTHRTVVANRTIMRAAQKDLRKTYHEHIIIHYCETPKKQVWQWAIQLPDGKGLCRCEHPFFSNDPPPHFLERVGRLAVSWEDEEKTTLVDVLARVREVLLAQNEFDLFSKWPSYAVKSDSLAMALRRGEPGAFDEFVQFHMPLARKSSRMLIRWFSMAPEDAEQTAMIGLIEAARRFDPERGYQFSTYASYWIRQACQRFGLEWGLPLRVPPHAFWPCYRMQFVESELIATLGQHEAKEKFVVELAAAGIDSERWESVCKARELVCFSDVDSNEFRHVPTHDSPEFAIDSISSNALHGDMAAALATLQPRQAKILALRYGIGQRENTLQEVADLLGITRERVRQIQAKAEEHLQRALLRIGYTPVDAGLD